MPTVDIALITASAEAKGHPSDCTEPAPGEVQNDSGSHNVTVKTSSGEYQVATKAIAAIHFDSHAHDYTAVEGCHENASHDVDPDDSKLLGITIAGSDTYPVDTGVTTDPKTGGNVNITSSPGSLSVKK